MTPKTDIKPLYDIVKKLRGPGGCPWDIEQTFETLTPHVIEEAYELTDALNQGGAQHLIEELGDVLLHVVMISYMAEERQLFLFQDVIDGICQKMIYRHPHVFGDENVNSVDDVWKQWEQLKVKEKQDMLTMDTVPKQLPALAKANKMQTRASRLGFDWLNTIDTLSKVKEEIAELEEAISDNKTDHIKEEAGDLLFAITNTIRKLEIDPEEALQRSNKKFQERFNYMERTLKTENNKVSDCTMDELMILWEKAKKIVG